MAAVKWAVAIALFFYTYAPATAQPQYAFRISFSDKGNQIASAQQVQLSERALQRRQRMHIPLDGYDLPVAASYLGQVTELTGGTIRHCSRWLNSCLLVLEDSANISKLDGRPFITSVVPVGYVYDPPFAVGNGADSTVLPLGAQKNTGNPAWYGTAWAQTHLVNGDCLHDKGLQGQGIIIAVLDDGFHFVNTAPGFDSVYNSGRIVETRNFVQGGTDVYTDFLTHGTSVFSTMAAYIPNTYVGAAPLAQYALYSTEDPTGEWPMEMDHMVAAFERADSIGADVISSSTGYNYFDPPYQNQSITAAQMDGKTTVAAIGANIAAQKGILVVLTAGNEGSGGLLTPGDADSALTVGNVDVNKVPASSSGHGPNASGIIKPEVVALGQPGAVMLGSATPSYSNGTSISTPQVAGFSACLIQASPGKSNSEIKRAIIASAHLYPGFSMPQLGYGVPDFCLADVLLPVREIEKTNNASAVPNPFSNAVHISVNLNQAENLTLDIYDASGRPLLHKQYNLAAGAHSLEIPGAANLPAGFYICSLRWSGGVQNIRLTKF